jgi:hypothetical protein
LKAERPWNLNAPGKFCSNSVPTVPRRVFSQARGPSPVPGGQWSPLLQLLGASRPPKQ